MHEVTPVFPSSGLSVIRSIGPISVCSYLLIGHILIDLQNNFLPLPSQNTGHIQSLVRHILLLLDDLLDFLLN
jgi:hypothetical protein